MLRNILAIYFFLVTISLTLLAQQSNSNNNYFQEIPPDSTPVIFAKGIISTNDYEHSSPAFSPFYDEIFWSIRVNGEYGKEIIKHISKQNNNWLKPEIASFSIMGKGDLYPTFMSDGKELYFTSDRFVPNSADSINRFIWKVKKKGIEWTEPEVIGFDSLDIYGFSISSNGTIYFMAQETKDRGSRNYDIYFSYKDGKKYTKPKKVGYPISTEYYEDCPFISKDEKFLIFESNRPGGYGKVDLYVSIKSKAGEWSEPKNLGKRINSEEEERFPYISPDGKYFFFGTNKNNNFNIFWVSASLIYDTIIDLK